MAYYSVGILICLCPYFICWMAVASDGNDARNGYKGKYGRKPAQYEVVVPLKVTETGEFVSHTIPHHYKRSYYGQRRQEDMGPEDKVHYVVPIGGESHHLELLPSNNIVSPGMVVEIHDKKGISEREMRKLGNIQCHYTGSVRGQEDSRAALSTCSGLSGYIRTKRGYFLIEPAGDHYALSGGKHPHHLYEEKVYPPDESLGCQTSGNIAKILAKRGLINSDDEKEEKRNRTVPRNVSQLHIETMIVVDKAMLNYHKEVDIESYVMTVFNMAHDLYHDATLGTNINLAIVRMIRLEDEESKLNLAVNRNAKKTLQFFRDWQNKMNPGDDTHPNHHDVAVLLTRIDICGDDHNCGLLGASSLGGMCDPKNQAAVCEDNGLRLGFVIAHEIAHTLSIPHDTIKESGCKFMVRGGLSTVMNPSVSIKTAEWSSCSGKFLKMFIDQGYGECLYDPPTDHSFEMPDILPGVMYGGDFQCREVLIPTAALCDTGMECDNLICYVENKGCIETHLPAAPGTTCGENKWCFHSQCVEIGERPGAVDGGWSKWTPWSDCTRTCGSGVSSKERYCTAPSPTHGGKYCIGEHKQHKICNTEPCEIGQPSFRNVQCAEFNGWIYPEDNKLHQWKAYVMADENPCILFCVNEQGEIAALLPRVVDGTKCLRGMRDICVDGICREIPCDLNLESNAVEDWCGVCHGDGTSCKLVTGEQFFLKGESKDSVAVKFFDIPKASVNIKVEETEPTNAKIQLKKSLDGSVLIEGDSFGMFDLPGTRAWFGNIRMKQEALNIPGPTQDCMAVWILPYENVTVKYSYGAKVYKKRHTHFDWDYIVWNKCSAQCGPGTQESVPKCVEKLAGMVDDEYCKSPKPKERIRPCEIAPCVPRWMIGDWQECNCARSSHVRIVKCIRPTGEGEGESEVIKDSECARPRPKEKEKCSCEKIRKGRKRSSENNYESTLQPFDQHDELKLIPKRCCEENSTDFRTIIDKENLKCLNLTIHQDFPNSIGESKEPTNSSTCNIHGKPALQFIDKLEKELGKKKPKV